MPQCVCNSGYEVVTQDVAIPASGQGAQEVMADLAIPSGKVVVGSGGILASINDDVADPSNLWWQAAIDQCAIQAGPHPTDPAKWRFFLSARAGDGAGFGAPCVMQIWVAVMYQ